MLKTAVTHASCQASLLQLGCVPALDVVSDGPFFRATMPLLADWPDVRECLSVPAASFWHHHVPARASQTPRSRCEWRGSREGSAWQKQPCAPGFDSKHGRVQGGLRGRLYDRRGRPRKATRVLSGCIDVKCKGSGTQFRPSSKRPRNVLNLVAVASVARWEEIRKFLQSLLPQAHSHLHDKVGSIANRRADTFAAFPQSTQWSKRLVSAAVLLFRSALH